jgi:energy-coupling factor transporter ATP-binding protein EcfA2
MLPLDDGRQSSIGIPSRICLVGETGSGKSTTADMLRLCLAQAGHRTRTIQLAGPLRRLQNLVYREIGEPKPPERQDQRLMFDLATNIRRISPTALVEIFEAAVVAVPPGTVVINADLRDHAIDAVRLRALGFYFIRVRCTAAVRRSRLGLRDDLSVVDDEQVFQLEAIPCDLDFDNSRPGLEHVRAFCLDLLEGIRCC